MVKCGICGKEVASQPKITEKGKCSECGYPVRRYWSAQQREEFGKLARRRTDR